MKRDAQMEACDHEDARVMMLQNELKNELVEQAMMWAICGNKEIRIYS